MKKLSFPQKWWRNLKEKKQVSKIITTAEDKVYADVPVGIKSSFS